MVSSVSLFPWTFPDKVFEKSSVRKTLFLIFWCTQRAPRAGQDALRRWHPWELKCEPFFEFLDYIDQDNSLHSSHLFSCASWKWVSTNWLIVYILETLFVEPFSTIITIIGPFTYMFPFINHFGVFLSAFLITKPTSKWFIQPFVFRMFRLRLQHISEKR